ncbi:MAG TPA: cupredoxin domain-containing protein [Dehalococcoidia bacterium]|jgi:plastocyanin
MRLDRLPVGEALVGFLAVALIATFLLAHRELPGSSTADAGANNSAGASATPAGSTAPGGLEITMTDNKFDNTELNAAAGATVTINIKNSGTSVHDVHVAAANGQFSSDFCSASGADPCSNPNRVAGGSTATLTLTVPNTPGAKIPYRCDFHSSEMNGTITVK